MTQEWTSAMSFSSFAPPSGAGDEAAAAIDLREDVEAIAMRWQAFSSRGALAGWASEESLRQAGVPDYGPLINRVVEIHGLMGSIGEQLALARAAELDAQRHRLGAAIVDPQQAAVLEHSRRMAVRALCEMSTHFVLGAAHGLANLVLRTVLCHSAAACEVNQAKRLKKAQGFPPGTDLKDAWLTFSPTGDVWSTLLPAVAATSGLTSLQDLVARLRLLQTDPRFVALEQRRGMDYHRHRPQSLDHTSPRAGLWSYDAVHKVSTMRMPGASADAERDEEIVHRISADALECLSTALTDLEPLLGQSLRDCHLSWTPVDA
ncbi:hypothetical protein ABZ027_39510 [Streptomyces sp. NPDC006332]|uniref:hypothetical protein n=1 Tax=Streptomyces sp. NPDC006332 TaxID=3155456 RepID=UPI0033B212B8